MVSVISQHLLSSELHEMEAEVARLRAPSSEALATMRMQLSATHAQTLAECKHLEVTLQTVRCEHTSADAALQSALEHSAELLREASATASLFLAHDEMGQLALSPAAAAATGAHEPLPTGGGVPAGLLEQGQPGGGGEDGAEGWDLHGDGGGVGLGASAGAAIRAAAASISAAASPLQSAAQAPHSLRLDGLGEGFNALPTPLPLSLAEPAADGPTTHSAAATPSRTPHLDALNSLMPEACAHAAMSAGQTRALASALARAIEVTSAWEPSCLCASLRATKARTPARCS